MKLPHGENAIVELAKLTTYCLSPTHGKGQHKAHVFESVLGITLSDAVSLQSLLQAVAIEGDAVQGTSDLYGTRYIIDFELSMEHADLNCSQLLDRSDWNSDLPVCDVLHPLKEPT